jgi:tRNA(His) 5'-end guanylyltransferase
MLWLKIVVFAERKINTFNEVTNMPVNDELGKRMKEYYEGIPKTKLMRRTPVAIRIDGKAFHTFTRGFEKPFDKVLIKSMQETMKYLCENIQGCVLGYTQSDEITLILVDYKNLNSAAWFDYEVQKMCSIAASMATMAFNKAFERNAEIFFCNEVVDDEANIVNETKYQLFRTYLKAQEKGAMFDARVFNIPKEEVTNLIYWRQLDATRNSIQMVGQANFSHKELQNKSCNKIQDMLLTERDINWNDYPTHQKRGSCCIKTEITTTCVSEENGEVKTWAAERPHWIIDTEIPIFKEDGRNYIEKLINF